MSWKPVASSLIQGVDVFVEKESETGTFRAVVINPVMEVGLTERDARRRLSGRLLALVEELRK